VLHSAYIVEFEELEEKRQKIVIAGVLSNQLRLIRKTVLPS
jgi:hypothetical protein